MRQHAWKLFAASGVALQSWTGLTDDCARCNASEQPATAAAAASDAAAANAATELAALADWLRQQGADIDAIEFKLSDKDVGRYGVYASDSIRQRAARGWWGTVAGWAGVGRNSNIAIAAFPLNNTLTAANLARHPQHGPLLQELLQLGVADERTAVMLHLAAERQRVLQQGGGGNGSGGGSSAWLALLPSSFSTTLYFSELDMQWLRGTTLHKATRLRQKSLRESWVRLQPAAKQLAEQSGVAHTPTLEDWVWANSVFWSRAIAFPSPTPDGSVVMQEGIVPGLDFCNHDATSACKWTVFGEAEAAATGRQQQQQQQQRRQRKGEAPSDVSLVCPRRHLPSVGQEVTINYGDKSNEELLFLYGFAVHDNPAEVLTIMCPLPPPSEWDAALQARLLLLQRRGLRPQLHLPAADLGRLGSSEAAKAQKAAVAAAAAKKGGSGRSSSGGGGAGEVLATDLPEGVLETLEVFVMPPQQVVKQLEAAEAAEAAGSGGSGGSGSSSGGVSEEEASGRRMAVLTTLVRLLELKAVEQEGVEEGTGPLESDEQLLAVAGDALPPNQRHALLYRMGQKQLTRAYLAHAKQLLQQEMAHLARLQADSA